MMNHCKLQLKVLYYRCHSLRRSWRRTCLKAARSWLVGSPFLPGKPVTSSARESIQSGSTNLLLTHKRDLVSFGCRLYFANVSRINCVVSLFKLVCQSITGISTLLAIKLTYIGLICAVNES